VSNLTPIPDTQTAYERIREYFSRPGAEQAVVTYGTDAPSCRYRTPEGNACAAGCLIPDELYDEGLEGGTFYALVDPLHATPYYNEELKAYFANVDPQFVRQAQIEHDDLGADFDTFIVRLDALALTHGLSVPA
jgi:hypothetical protein